MCQKKIISIIIPIFNKQNYLDICLESIVKQTYSELDIILIDDGSTDKSYDICKKWEKLDTRIRVFNKKNGGVASARNYGLEKAKGEYIAFVDPDDYLKLECIEKLYMALKNNDTDIAYCFAWDIIQQKKETHTLSLLTGKTYLLNSMEYDWINWKRHTVAWGALYKSNLIKKIQFDEDLSIGEDTLFFARCVRNAKNLVCLDDALYFYNINDCSVTMEGYSHKKMSEEIAWKRVCELFEDNSHVLDTAKAAYALTCKTMIGKYCKSNTFIESDLAYLEKNFKKYFTTTIKCLILDHQYILALKTIYSKIFWKAWLHKKMKNV